MSLFIFATDADAPPMTLDLPAQKAVLREKFAEAKWESTRFSMSWIARRTCISTG